MYIQDACWEVSAVGHEGTTEHKSGFGAYEAASALIEAGRDVTVIKHGSSGHARSYSWQQLHADYGPMGEG